MERIACIIGLVLIIMNNSVWAETGLPIDTWRYDVISGDAVMATAGSRFWMIQTGADYKMFGRWASGVRCFYWETRSEDFSNVYAIDGHLTRQLLYHPNMHWNLSTGIGVKGSSCNNVENPIQVTLDMGTAMNIRLFSQLFFNTHCTWMFNRDELVAPFWAGIQVQFNPMIKLGVGISGVNTIKFSEHNAVSWETAPAIQFSIKL